ncbi:S8 family peptidase [Algoriphagus halophilus]|uniref:Subtilase family protein n=1 Tax=Algoriphagus halophilus TaxID=226505 RepID=A0A1N6DL30_9BACT|nr:S8 family serine peptidase [Algoriphagus halophilus]SIN71446.1 Subtilase family protein [Algoriphagus halophilus]
MRRFAYFFVFLCLGWVSCSKSTLPVNENDKNQVVTEHLYNYELVFTDDADFKPLSNNSYCEMGFSSEGCQSLVTNLKNGVIEFIKSIDSTIQVDKNHIRVYSEVSVYMEELTASQYENLNRNSVALNYFSKQIFELQIRRPIMQSDFIEQTRKPIMQEQLRYDSLSKSSTMIQEIGGGQPGLPVQNHRVWIVDSGIDKNHQDLNFEPAQIDLSADFSVPSSNPKNDPFNDENGHGTFMAGVIGGLASSDPIYLNGYGVNGVYPNAKMISIKIFDKNDNTNTAEIVSALNHILSNSISGDIVNLSWGSDIQFGDCTAPQYLGIRTLILTLANQGVKVVMSAGNSSKESLTNFPGCIDATNPNPTISNIYTIGSVEIPCSGTYLYSSFSDYGRPTVDYLAPGEDIFTTALGGEYVLVSGTSLSAAMFSGILYHNQGVGTLTTIKRGAATGDPDPDYPVAKIGN